MTGGTVHPILPLAEYSNSLPLLSAGCKRCRALRQQGRTIGFAEYSVCHVRAALRFTHPGICALALLIGVRGRGAEKKLPGEPKESAARPAARAEAGEDERSSKYATQIQGRSQVDRGPAPSQMRGAQLSKPNQPRRMRLPLPRR
jgi:hypothetical protein